MSRLGLAGTALRLLCLPITFALLASCAQPARPPHKLSEGEENEQLIAAMKNHPSLQPGSNEAGPPITVNPYPPSAGMNAKHGDHQMPHR
jgi:hypothetical protein